MNPNETPEYELDDILTEFSDPTLEDILKEFSTPEAPPVPEQPEAPAEEPEPLTDATAVFTPVAEDAPEEVSEEAPAPAPSQPKVKAEPFSDEWEPEYEEPMGEFTPKAPIPFPKKSRLRQLRQKLVAGPERRYQALCEAGIGQLQIGIMLTLLLAVISVALTVICALGLFDPTRLRTVVFCQLLISMLAALVGCYRLLDGLAGLFRGRFTLDAALIVTFLACIADGLLCLSQQRLSASSLFCLQILMSQWAAYQRRSTEMGQMDVLRKASDLTAIVKIENFCQERPGYAAVEGEPEDFLERYRKPSTPEKILSVYAVLSLVTSFALAVTTYLLGNMNTAVQVFMAAQLIALPFSAFICASRPTAILQGRLHRLGAVLCGWQGIRAVQRRAVYPLRHEDVFPDGAIKMQGVKFFGTVDPGRIVSYTTALLTAEGSGLLSVFRQLPRSRSSSEHTVEEFSQEQDGISGLIDGCRLLVGTRECMEAHGIPLPPEITAPLALYTAVNNRICGAFSLSCNRSKSTVAGLRTLCGDSHLKPMLISCGFLLTPKFLRNRLSINPKRITFPDRDTRQALSQISPDENAPVIALTTKPGLAPKAYALTGARSLQGALKWGAAIHIAGGIIGLAAVGVLALHGGLALLSPVNLLLYSTIWSLPGLLITERTRYI